MPSGVLPPRDNPFNSLFDGATQTVGEFPTPTIPVYSYTSDKALTGSCRLTNYTDATGQGIFSNVFQCEQLALAGSAKRSSNGSTAAAIVLGVLFAVAVGLLILLWWRGRRMASTTASQPFHELKQLPDLDAPPSSAPMPSAHELSSLQHQLSLERRHVTDLQAALLSQTSQTATGWSSAQPTDDRDVKRFFAVIFSEIKDFAGNYYRTSSSTVSSTSSSSIRISLEDISDETREILDDSITDWEAMAVGDAKGRLILVRIIVGEYLRRCWIDGSFLGNNLRKAVRVVEEGVVAASTMEQSHLWRVQTLQRLAKTVNSKTRQAIVTTIAETIIILTSPFFSQVSNPAAAKKYLENTVGRMSSLYFLLAEQNAYYQVTPYITFSERQVEGEEAKFELASCEDVEQRFDIGTDSTGREWSAAEGMSIKGFVFPAVVKYGDGRGGGWNGEVIMVYKAQVVL
ncbi:hypothetical protein ABW20_dc0101419 [Dactylellina cionopaga]|nr:hypothetical protein ABW20_dc0101419 [Dactylellina cionopaga]